MTMQFLPNEIYNTCGENIFIGTIFIVQSIDDEKKLIQIQIPTFAFIQW